MSAISQVILHPVQRKHGQLRGAVLKLFSIFQAKTIDALVLLDARKVHVGIQIIRSFKTL